MNSIKDAFSRVGSSTGTNTSENGTDSGAELASDNKAKNYSLRVTTGPSYDPSTHSVVHVNGASASTFESESMSVKVRVRVRGYNGLPKGSPSTSAYFEDPDHKNDQYSIAFSFIPKKHIPSVNLVWGNDFDHPIRDRIPPGFNTAFRIVKNFIDPGLECDAYADEPWLYGPALSCWFALRIGETSSETNSTWPKHGQEDIIVEGADGSGKEIRASKGLPDGPEKRRKFFLDENNRRNFDFEQGRCYEGDFHNPYLDFSNYALKLPGFSLGVLKYIGDKSHSLRYVLKDRKTGEVFFVVVLTLLFGPHLEATTREASTQEVDQPANPATT